MFIYLSRKHDRETRKAADIWKQIHEFAKVPDAMWQR